MVIASGWYGKADIRRRRLHPHAVMFRFALSMFMRVRNAPAPARRQAIAKTEGHLSPLTGSQTDNSGSLFNRVT